MNGGSHTKNTVKLEHSRQKNPLILMRTFLIYPLHILHFNLKQKQKLFWMLKTEKLLVRKSPFPGSSSKTINKKPKISLPVCKYIISHFI